MCIFEEIKTLYQMNQMTKQIVKTQETAIDLLKSKGADDIDQVIGRCGCGETTALLGYNLDTDDFIGRVAVCKVCGDE